MDKEIIRTYEDGDFRALSSKLRELTIDHLQDLVDDHILRKKSFREPAFILRAIFKGCSIEKNYLSSHSLAVFTRCLKLLTSPDVSQKVGTDIFGILFQEVDQLSTGGLVDTTKIIIEMIRNGDTGHGRAIKVLPKVLTCLEQKHEVHLGPGQGSMPGHEYKKHLINTLCSGKWSGKSFIHLTIVFKDVAMSSDEMGFFLRKMLRQLERLDVHEIPPLVYQLLTLASETHHGTLLRGIFAAFGKLDDKDSRETEKTNEDGEFWDDMFESEEIGDSERTAKNTFSKDLKAVEGTVLLHLTNKAKSDQSFTKAFIKMLKLAKDAVSSNSISNLFLAFALCLAQTENFREQVLEQLRTIIFRSLLHRHREAHSNWLRQRLITVSDIRKILLDVLGSSKHGWDEVVAGAVYLGFCLMDTYGPKGGAFGRPLEGEPAKEDTPRRACCDLGATLIANAFKLHPGVRTEVVEQIMNRVVTKTSSPITHYIDVLKGISKRYPSTLLASKRKLREFFNCICLLSPQNADAVLRSVLPLIRINGDLKDSLILVLRKAMCSCQMNGHVIACNGFLLLLRCFKLNGSFVSLSQASSQSSQSLFSICSQTSGSLLTQTFNHEPLCLEVLSTLRRCLMQQATIRDTLYRGLWDVVVNNPRLTTPIVEKLLKHFGRYYEAHEGVIPPIIIEKCIGMQNKEPTLIEPLPLLMSSLFIFLTKAKQSQMTTGVVDDDDDDILNPSLLASVREMFESMTTRMAKSEMEDFELDKAAEFSNSTSVGKKNIILANLVLGCYQTMIEYNFLQDDLSEETAGAILRLYSCLKKIKDVVGKALSSNDFHASPVFVKSLIESLFCDAPPDKEVGLGVLRGNDDFVNYAVEIAHVAVVRARDHGTMQGIGGQDKLLVRDTCMTVGRACLREFALVQSDPSTSTIGYSCLEVFLCSLQYVASRKRKRMGDFLASVVVNLDDVTSSKDASARDRCIRRFQRIVISYLSGDVPLSAVHKKIVPLLISVLDLLSAYSGVDNEGRAAENGPPRSSTPYPTGITQVNEWVGKLCSEQIIDDNAITKSLLSLHLKLSTACGPWVGTERSAQGSEGAIRDMAKDIHTVTGDIELNEGESRMDEETKRGSHYPIIDECNVITLVPLIVSHIDAAIEETDWVLQRVRGQVISLLAEDKFKDSQGEAESLVSSDFHEKRRKTESAMCTRLGNILIACRELIQSALPLGPPAESALRGLTKLFTLLASFTKYHTWLVTQGVSEAPPPRFEKLVKLIGTEVTRFVYPFINHVEGMQSSRGSQAAKKRKRTDDKDSAATKLKKQKVLRETKSIPPLIYAIENLERFLITLGKKCKMDLLSGHKLPTSRDFRIKSSVMKEITLAARERSPDAVQALSDAEEGGDGQLNVTT